MRIAVLMPVYEEGDRLGSTLRELGDRLGPPEDGHHVSVFLVDDGSRRTLIDPDALPKSANLRVVFARHPVNLGQGAALETARRLALQWSAGGAQRSFDAYVTMDSDGQHRPEDALALARAIEDGADVALGDRFAGDSNVPFTRRILLSLARVFERWTTGLVLSDAHNGLRAFSPRAIVHMRLRQNRMAHATEMTRRISNARLELVEVPVSIRYTDETLAKGQTAGGAVAILVDLFQGFLFGSPE